MKRTSRSASLASANRTLRHLAFDLREVYDLLDDLCAHLAGGGIVQARDIETSVASAMPKVRRAVNALNALNLIADEEVSPRDDDDAKASRQPPHLN